MAKIRHRGEGAAPARDRTGTGLRRHQGGAGAIVDLYSDVDIYPLISTGGGYEGAFDRRVREYGAECD